MSGKAGRNERLGSSLAGAALVGCVLAASTAPVSANEANECVSFETTSDTVFVKNNCSHGISISFDPIPPETIGGTIDVRAGGKQTMAFTFDVHKRPRFHACFKPRDWYNGRCYQIGEEVSRRQPSRSVPSRLVDSLGRPIDVRFCSQLRGADQTLCRNYCRSNIKNEQDACIGFHEDLSEYLREYQREGLTDNNVHYGTVSSSTRSSHHCDRGQIWSNATTGYYRCECPPGEYLDQGGPCR